MSFIVFYRMLWKSRKKSEKNIFIDFYTVGIFRLEWPFKNWQVFLRERPNFVNRAGSS